MVKYVLKNNEKFAITDELYESLIKNGDIILLEKNSMAEDIKDGEIKRLKDTLFNYAKERVQRKISEKYGTTAENEWLKDFKYTPINPNGTDKEKTTTESVLLSNEIREMFNNELIMDVYKKDLLDLLNYDELSIDIEEKINQMADNSFKRYQEKQKNKEKNNKNPQLNLPFNDKKNNIDNENDNYENDNDDNEKFNEDIDIDSDKRSVFIKNSLQNKKIPLFDEKFKDIVEQKNIDILESLYNSLYYCGTTQLKAKGKINKLKKKYKNLDEFYAKRDEETQKIFDLATKKWWDNVYAKIAKNKPNQVKILDKMMSSVKKEDDDYDLQQEFSLKAKASADIIKRIKDIMKNVGKVNYVNYVFTNVPNLSTVKKYYLSELQTNASYGEDRETELNKIEEIRNADSSLFQQISKRLLVHGDINEYIKVIRYDDVLDGVFTVTKTERATTLGQQRIILTFTENSTREVMFVLVIEPTFGALKQLFKGLDVSGVKNAVDNLNKKL